MTQPLSRVIHRALAAAALVASAHTALAADQTIVPSSACQPPSTDSYGALTNTTTYSIQATCGIGQDKAADINDDVRVYYNDRNPGAGKNFRCIGFSVSEDLGTIFTSNVRYGCSAAGGCSSDPGVYSSQGYLTVADIRHAGGSLSTSIQCLIPAFAPPPQGAGTSVLKTLFLDEQGGYYQ